MTTDHLRLVDLVGTNVTRAGPSRATVDSFGIPSGARYAAAATAATAAAAAAATTAPTAFEEVAVIGLGYVGLTLAVAFSESGAHVIGYDAQPSVTAQLATGRAQFHEPHLEPGLARGITAGTITIAPMLPPALPSTVIVCVGTPVDDRTKEPDMAQLLPAIDALAPRITDETLVVLRSTVPIGTTRGVLLGRLQAAGVNPLVAFAPERTIQGQALEEIRRLPQVVGGATPEATRRATALFSRLCQKVVPLSSLEAAEMVKLICNAHTDLIYGYGNEVAMMAEALGLDADEVIAGANIDYPRPDICRPGFVGGSCLTKDPYLLAHSVRGSGYVPSMVLAARRTNEWLPTQVAERVLAALRCDRSSLGGCTVLLAGVAYKGRPETDDTRGAPWKAVADRLADEVGLIRGHDYVVPDGRIAGLGLKPVTLREGFDQADAVVFLTDHPRYAREDVMTLLQTMRRPPVVFDAWGIFKSRITPTATPDVRYLRLGRA